MRVRCSKKNITWPQALSIANSNETSIVHFGLEKKTINKRELSKRSLSSHSPKRTRL